MSLSQKKLLSLIFVIVLCFGLAAGQSEKTAKYGVLDAAGDLGLGSFSSALESAGLTDTLNNQGVLLFGKGSFAVFAPTDEAFSNATDVDINGIMANQTELRRILRYHAIWNDGVFENISEVSSMQTLQGGNLTLDSENGLEVNGSKATASKKYDNGTIYVIDKVLVPKDSSTMGVIEAANAIGAKKFAAAIKSSDLADRLNGQGLLGIESLSEGPFTIFAPSDAAFDKAKAAMDSISKKDGGMTTLLSYHAVDASALLNRTEMNSVKTIGGDSLAIDTGAGLVGGAKVLKSERYDNGIIYVIDQVLVPIRLSM
jgi:uncharacterized surface protein with fasciclin (FAS1) repeats